MNFHCADMKHSNEWLNSGVAAMKRIIVNFAVWTTVMLAVLALGACLLTGCSVQPAASTITAPAASVVLSGHVHGGQQPVSGASIQLWAAGSGGYGSASTALLTPAVLSDANGNFNITDGYTCPSASTQVYITATGGNPGLTAGTDNTALAMMTALGSCGNLQSTTFISVNELTTVASVWSLSHYMSSSSAIGASATNATGLASAFASVNKVVNTTTGSLPGTALPANATLPTAEIDTLADILAGCINSVGGVAGDSSPCGNLLSAATPAGSSAPADTIEAAIDIARNPGTNVAAIFALASANAPFQPALTSSPTDWMIGINYVGGGLSAPVAMAVDSTGNIWFANGGANSISELSSTGAAVSSAAGYTGGGLNVPSAIAIDLTGNVWVANSAGNSVSKFTSAGVPVVTTAFTGGGLNTPKSLSIDGYDDVWLANSGNNSVTELNSSGQALSGGYGGGGISSPTGIAINPQ